MLYADCTGIIVIYMPYMLTLWSVFIQFASIWILKCRRWGMPAHWLQVESCLAGFKSEWSESCSVFYPSTNVLFSEGSMTMNERWHRHCVWRESEVIHGHVAHVTPYVRLTCQQWTTAITSWVKFQNSYHKEL